MILAEDQRLRIPSKPESLLLVERMVEDVCDVLGVKEEVYGNILLSVTEAVNNAIQHGNKYDLSKVVEISFYKTDQDLTFIIKDEGNGFDFNHLKDPTDPENLESPHGRGVFLMKNLADSVTFENEGREVKIGFKIID
jgi:serine/threonine-protein kinase RsbW